MFGVMKTMKPRVIVYVLHYQDYQLCYCHLVGDSHDSGMGDVITV